MNRSNFLDPYLFLNYQFNIFVFGRKYQLLSISFKTGFEHKYFVFLSISARFLIWATFLEIIKPFK